MKATTVEPPTFDQLVNESDYVVRGVVKGVTSEFKPSTNGRKKIVTKIVVDVLEVVIGTPPAPLILETLGGRVGDEELVLEGAPQFKVGDHNIFFVSGNGKNITPLYAMSYGFYPIQEETAGGKKYVARGNKVPLESTAEVALSMEEHAAASKPSPKTSSGALTPEQFVQQIRSAVNPGYRRAKSN